MLLQKTIIDEINALELVTILTENNKEEKCRSSLSYSKARGLKKGKQNMIAVKRKMLVNLLSENK